MIKLSNMVLQNSSPVLSKLAQESLPIKISYILAKNIQKITDELKVYNDEREKLIEKYGKKDENDKLIISKDNQITFKEECVTDWNRDFVELLNIENDIDIKTFSIDKLDEIKISPNEIMAIDYMIED